MHVREPNIHMCMRKRVEKWAVPEGPARKRARFRKIGVKSVCVDAAKREMKWDEALTRYSLSCK